MDTKDYLVRTEPVLGGFDLIISHHDHSAVLFIQDIDQAETISNRLIASAIEQRITINAAFSIFNQGSSMYPNEMKPI